MIDLSKDPYGRRYYARLKRKEFEKLKKTPGFKHWRIRQGKIQRNRCAYCKIKLSYETIITHIDHVTPLYYDGKNDYENFVLSCRRCNLRKWVSDKYVVPEWIKKNDELYKQEQRLSHVRFQQYKQFAAIIEEVEQEKIAESLRWIV